METRLPQWEQAAALLGAPSPSMSYRLSACLWERPGHVAVACRLGCLYYEMGALQRCHVVGRVARVPAWTLGDGGLDPEGLGCCPQGGGTGLLPQSSQPAFKKWPCGGVRVVGTQTFSSATSIGVRWLPLWAQQAGQPSGVVLQEACCLPALHILDSDDVTRVFLSSGGHLSLGPSDCSCCKLDCQT